VVHDSAGGWSSLPVGAREQEKFLAFSRWVLACWYELALVIDCKNYFIIIKRRQR